MFRLLAFLVFLVLAPVAGATAPIDAEAEARAAVAELGRLNGLALACQQPELSARAKRLMIAHVPKLRDWGEIYETATNSAFLTPTTGCPDAANMRVQIELTAAQLARLLPASPQPAEVLAPDAGITPRYLLKGPDGQAVMDSDFAGRFQLIAFGYTFCPDICPTTLVEMAHVMKLLGDDAKRIQPIFISVDPERDTPVQLKAYTGFFDPRIIGLTGSPEVVRRIADFFKVRYERVLAPGASHYSIDHSAGMYLLGPAGEFIVKFAYATPVEDMTARIREAMAQAPAPRTPTGGP
ncbi:MAG TPA: SCO family protein [Rhodocyclaceae bacterium]|nr:SCO family protein [Rhodocyclaceae bacterium]